MIENPFPDDWKELQDNVSRIFNEIGLESETNKKFTTPRGTVNIDVFAIDKKSVDKIKYIVECKNWSSAIPQSVVHSFTTVMNEIGANIGYLISRKALQRGAEKYTNNTNIIGMTYEQFQLHYFEIWYKEFFAKKIGDIGGSLIQYVEPINSHREKKFKELSAKEKDRFNELFDKYFHFGILIMSLEMPRYSFFSRTQIPNDFKEIQQKIQDSIKWNYTLKSKYFRELLEELTKMIREAIEKFNDVFGENIFDY